MRRTFSLPEKTSWFIVFFFVTSYLHLEVEAIYSSSVDNWCSEKHCNNCANSEFLRCSENALFSQCGDLCGCCQSCVHFRDLGESCGSQLAVRSSATENFGDASSRVTIIATSSCKRGLVCSDFVCKGKNEAVDSFNAAEVENHAQILNIENGFPTIRDLPTDVIKQKNQIQFDYQDYNRYEAKHSSADEYGDSDDALVRKITRPTLTSKPLVSLPEMLLEFRTHEKEVSNIWESVMPALNQNIQFGSPRRFLNLIIDDREFQLIYGHDALDDLKILIKSVDESQPHSFLNAFETETIYQRFKNLLDYINNKEDKPVTKKEPNLGAAKEEKNEDTKFVGNALHTKKFLELKKNEFYKISNTESPQLFTEQLRSKRETIDAENTRVHLGIQYNNVNPKKPVNRELSSHDSMNQPSESIKNVNKGVTENVVYSMEFPLVHSFLFARIPYARRSEFRIERFRKKRDTNDAEEPKIYIEPQSKKNELSNFHDTTNPNNKIYDKSKFPISYFANETPRTMEKVDHHWPVVIEEDAEDELLIDQKVESGATETVMNIHMTGVPGPRNTAENLGVQVKGRMQEKRESDESVEEDYGHYDVGLEVFVSEANAKVPAVEAGSDLHDFENFARVEVSKTYKKVGIDKTDNVTEKLASDNSQFIGSGYQSTFPKTPGNDYLHELIIRVNETVEEFRTRLDRIEMKLVAIVSSIFNHFFELRSNDESRITGESKDSNVSINGNPVERQPASMNTLSITISTPQKANQFTEIPAMSHTKWTRFPEENSTGRSQHRRWRDFMVLPGVPTNLRARRKRPNQIRGNGIDLPLRKSRRKIITRFPVVSVSNFSAAPNSSATKFLEEDTTKLSVQFTPPVIFSDANYRHFPKYSSASVQRNQHTSNILADEHSGYEMNSNPLIDSSLIGNRKIVWPFNLEWYRGEKIKTSTPETFAVAESILSLETQIPEPLRSGLFTIFGHQLDGELHSVNDEFSEELRDETADRNLKSWVAEPLINLFIVENKNAELESEKSLEVGESPQSFILPAKNERTVTIQRNSEINSNWNQIYPEYLDYAEEPQKNGDQETIDEVATTQVPESHRNIQRIGSVRLDRKKRNVELISQEKNQEELINRKKKWLNDVLMDLKTNKSAHKNNIYKSFFPKVFENVKKNSSENMIATLKLPKKRKRRSVQMVDWLRAAQEYHERLHQIRTAALKTWLVSQDELEHSNLTNVKLFTREIPAYLEQYTPDYNVNYEPNEATARKKIYSVVTEDYDESMTNDDELFGRMIADLSSQFEDKSKKNVDRNSKQSPEISSSSMPRKFTIVTTGNSTIRIDEMPEIIEDGIEFSHEGQSERETTNSEVLSHEVDFMPSDSEIFDHMYEGIDAEDEDFDYGDPEFIVSRLLDELDVVVDSNEENSEASFEATSEDSFDQDEDVANDEDVITKLFSRTKRDSPFFLFKAKGNPARDVVIWPSNWQHLISRHLKFNRLKNSATQPQKGARRSYVKLSKVIPKHVPTLETSAKIFSTRELSSTKING